MLTIRRAQDRGHAQHGWLDSYHSFSFADYYDPAHMGFRVLRVINEDRVEPGRGFGTHGHRDMEIISYVLEGGLQHKDSMGNGSVIHSGDVQLMSAGTGVTHSEFNGSQSELVHFLQIWIIPSSPGGKPSYQEKRFPEAERLNTLRLVVSPTGENGALRIKQDMSLYAALLEPKQRLTHALRPGRHAWVQIARGTVELNGQSLSAGDGAALSDESEVALRSTSSAELLVFDLP
jgi:redox-sensitive bicupin YhaK (pirin superfamily)